MSRYGGQSAYAYTRLLPPRSSPPIPGFGLFHGEASSACNSNLTLIVTEHTLAAQVDKLTRGAMAVYGYVRVSTARQASEGESLDVQGRQIEGYAHMMALDVTEVFVEEGVSGSKPLAERPEGARLLAALKPGDTVIAAKLDRLFRSALDALQMVEHLNEMEVSLRLLDLGGGDDIASNGMSKLFLTIAAAFAEAERDRIRERITGVKADQRARGRYLGGRVPFGFTVGDDGQLIEDPHQQAAIKKAKRLKEKGRSLRSIAAQLQVDGFKLSHEGVKGILATR